MAHIHVHSKITILDSRKVTGTSARQWFQTLQLTSWYFISTRQPWLRRCNVDQSRFTTWTAGHTVWRKSTAITRTGVTQSLAVMVATIQLLTTNTATQVLYLK